MWDKFKQLFGGKPGTPPSKAAGSAAKNERAPAGKPKEADLAACYAELDVLEGSDLNTIRRAWKAKLRETHRDHYAEDPEVKRRAQETAQRINEAYQTLYDHLF